MSSPLQLRMLQRTMLRRAAAHYTQHGWPVVPGAYPTVRGFRCDRPGCPTRGCHPAFEDWRRIASCDPDTVAAWWSRRGHSVLFPTGIRFDVIEVPTALGEPALWPRPARQGGTRHRFASLTGRCPVATTPDGRWMFFVHRGDELRRELADRLQVILHGDGSWVPAPPTRFPDGRVCWRVSPAAVGWRLGDPQQVQRALVRAGEPERTGPTYLVSPRLRFPGTGGSRGSCRRVARR